MLNTANTDQGGIKLYQILLDQSYKTVKLLVQSNPSGVHEHADSLVL